ncbi:MAG: VOC family protein [bacterium]
MLSDARGSLVAIRARDFERAVSFYRDVLGLPMTFRHENYWAEFHAPGLSIGIEAAEDGLVVGGGTISILFEVAGIEKFVERLRNRGVSFLGQVRETFHGKEAYFTDSEGNPIVLHQSVTEPMGAARVEKARGATSGATAGAKRKAAKSSKANSPAKKRASKPGRAKKRAAKKPAAKSTPAKKKRATSTRGGASRRAKR